MISKTNKVTKTTILILLITVFAFSATNYLSSLKRKLATGNPVFNETIGRSKGNKTFICSYLQSSNPNNLFKEVWLENQGVLTSRGVENTKKLLLTLSTFTDIDTSINITNANFKFFGFGLNSKRLFVIEPQYSEIATRDTLRITFLYQNREIVTTLVRQKTN